MSKLILTLAVLALFSTALAVTSEEVTTLWGAWKTAHNKHYLPSEENHRFMVFQQSVAKVAKLNAEYVGAKFAINEFSDLTSEEFKQKFTSDLVEDHASAEESHPSPITEMAPFPDSLDWRTKRVVTPVKNQVPPCNSYWAFAAVAALESLNMITYPTRLGFPDYSEQQMVDCGRVIDGLKGCSGGSLQQAFQYAYRYGLMNETYYPYKAKDGTKCLYSHKISQVVLNHYPHIQGRLPAKVKIELMKNPIAVSIQGDQDVMRFYKSGVISTGCGPNLNHAGLIVGYQQVDGQEAWIVKNSWGYGWGVQGYVYISTNGQYNNGYGACGILSFPIRPFYNQF